MRARLFFSDAIRDASECQGCELPCQVHKVARPPFDLARDKPFEKTRASFARYRSDIFTLNVPATLFTLRTTYIDFTIPIHYILSRLN